MQRAPQATGLLHRDVRYQTCLQRRRGSFLAGHSRGNSRDDATQHTRIATHHRHRRHWIEIGERPVEHIPGARSLFPNHQRRASQPRQINGERRLAHG